MYGFGSGKRGQLGICADKTTSVGIPKACSGFEGVEVVAINANGDQSAALSGEKSCFVNLGPIYVQLL